jgi:hypothetical protein
MRAAGDHNFRFFPENLEIVSFLPIVEMGK